MVVVFIMMKRKTVNCFALSVVWGVQFYLYSIQQGNLISCYR